MLASQATFRLLKGARSALGDTPHVDMLLRRLMLVVLHRADTALFHKLVGGARPGYRSLALRWSAFGQTCSSMIWMQQFVLCGPGLDCSAYWRVFKVMS